MFEKSDPFFSRFAPVNADNPCPVCDRPTWCVVALDGRTALCQRVESPKRFGNAGWSHELENAVKVPVRRATKPKLTADQLRDKHHEFTEHPDRIDRLHELAEKLGVSPYDMIAMGVGWTGFDWSFPMRTARGELVGFRLRRPDGQKRSVKGSREGLFMQDFVGIGPLSGADDWFVAEGPTDTLALWRLGLDAVGRPSCVAGGGMLMAFFDAVQPGRITIIADNDGPGRRGAIGLAAALVLEHGDTVSIIAPVRHKDVREYVQHGGTRQSIMEVVTTKQSNTYWEWL